MPPQNDPDHSPLQGLIVSTPGQAHGAEIELFCPAFAGRPAGVADLLACLPIVDVNGILLDVLPTAGLVRPVVGVLAVDPFRPMPRLLRELGRHGVRGIVNLPSVGFLDHGSFREAMAASGFSFAAELRALAVAAAEGFDAFVVVRSLEQGEQAMAAGLRRLIVHPGPAPKDPRQVVPLAQGVEALLRELRQRTTRGACQLLLYRHPDLDAVLGASANAADGTVAYAA